MKIKFIILGLVGSLLMSCGDEFLTINSKTALTDDVYYKTQADLQAAINAVYAPFRELYTGTSASSNGANAAYLMGEMHSDNARFFYQPQFRATVSQEEVANFIHLASNSVSTFKYQRTYSVIANANKVLSTVDNATFTDEALMGNIKGQALCLRGFAYFDLVQYFGSIPLHTEPVITFEGTALPLASVADVYTQIISDLNEAIGLLPARSAQADLGRVTKGTAQMILANVYMVQKNYAAAETLLRAIISSNEYSLMTNYASIFAPANKNNKESIFEIQYRAGSDGYSSTFCYGMLPYPLSTAAMAALTGTVDAQANTGGAEGFNAPSPDLLAAYETGDSRYDATIGTVANTRGETLPFCKKYLHPHERMNQSNDNWPVYRYAEVLLFLAEALNEQNKPTEALPFLNQVRSRAGLAASSASSQSDVRNAIAKERRIEFAFENKRWLDLVRTGKAVEVITAFGNKVKANPSAYYYFTGFQLPVAAFADIQLTWPLPAAESLYTPYF